MKNLKRAIVIMAPFVFIACEKSNDQLGLNQVIGDQALLADTTLDVISYTRSVDSTLVALPYEQQLLIGRYVGNRLIGSTVDPIFGRSSSSMVAQMLLSTVNVDFGPNPRIDSVGLYLRYTGSFGDTSQPMSFDVHQLQEPLDRDTTYYSSYRPVLGQKISLPNSIKPLPNKLVSIGGQLTVPTLNIPLDTSFFQQNFADLADGSFSGFSSNDDFIEYFKGIHVSTSTAAGSILYFDLSSSNSIIRIYYHNDEEDSLQVSLNFSQLSDVVPIHFNLFEHDYQNYPTAFDLDNIDSIQGEQQTYLESMGGVVTMLEIPGLAGLANNGLLINQAVLEIQKAGGTGNALPPPARLELRTFSEGIPRSLLSDFRSRNTIEGDGAFRSEPLKQGRYKFVMTRYVFDVANGAKSEKLVILPTVKSTAAHKVVLEGGMLPDSKLQLKLYYTKP